MSRRPSGLWPEEEGYALNQGGYAPNPFFLKRNSFTVNNRKLILSLLFLSSECVLVRFQTQEHNKLVRPTVSNWGEGSRSYRIIKGGLPDQETVGFCLGEDCRISLGEGYQIKKGSRSDQEVIMKGWRHGRKKQYLGEEDQKMSMAKPKMSMAEYKRNMQEMREILQEIKIHIKGLGRSDESVMKGQKEGSNEEEMEEDMDPLGWISHAEKFFDTKNVTEKERLRLAYICMEGGTALIIGFRGRVRGSVFEKKRETRAAVLSVDGFARIRGEDRREENICGEEGNDENCDGDIGVTAAGKVAKAVVSTVAKKVAKAVVFNVAEKVAKAAVFTEKVAKVVVFSGDSVVGGGVMSKHNWEQKEEDATDNNGARKGEETPIFLWVKREELITYEGIDTQYQTTGAANASKVQNTKGSTKAHPSSKENVVQGCKTWHQKFNLQVDGTVVKSVVATRDDEVRVEILRTSQNWVKRTQEEWKSLVEDLPPPKPPDLNWRAASSGFPSYGNRSMKRSHEIKFSDSNLEDKVVLQRGVMIGYRMIGYNRFRIEGRGNEKGSYEGRVN
ncbi:hypothetical protein V8G54_022997 [Vigna mungo]|uniref:Uncharacterized protein n=1 Tax=Vigna mungo TaxID=3915 RepID=A0AAQ3RS55_VIGMU